MKVAIVAVLAAAIVVLLPAPTRRRAIAWIRRAATGVGALIGVVLMVPAALFLCVLSVTQRLLGVDPLNVSRTRPGTWRVRDGVDQVPERSYIAARWHGEPVPFHRTRSTIASFLAVLLMVIPLAFVAREVVRPRAPELTAAGDDAFWPELWAETHEFIPSVDFDAVTTYRPKYYRGRYVNQGTEGRRTWTPPPCSCPTYDVWLFGGSAAWGQFQRDEYSLASLLSKAAWKQNVALRIQNRAVPSFALGQEVREFGTLLSKAPPPDLAIFYDGVNDLALQNSRNGRGLGADESEVSLLEVPFGFVLDVINGGWVLSGFKPSSENGTVLPGVARGPTLDADGVAMHTLARYQRNRVLADAIAAQFDVATLYVWQPTLMTSRPGVADSGAGSPDGLFADAYLSSVSQLPPGVVDLSGALLGRTDDFFDGAHHNEAAAAQMADVLLPEVLDRLQSGGGSGP